MGKKKKKKGKAIEYVDTEPRNEVTTDITLCIDEEPYIEMMQYAHEFSPDECSGVGLVEREEFANGSVEFTVKKVYLPLQKNSQASTDIEDDELNKLNTKLVEEGEDTSLLRFHWHSHVDMSVFHSGTDEENYDDMQTGDYGVSLVVNKDYNMLGSVHLYKPIRINVLNIDVEPPSTVDLDEYKLPKDLRKKIEDNVERVLEHERVEARSKVIYPISNYQNGLCSKCGYSYYYCRCPSTVISSADDNDFGQGLANDYDFIQLLKAGQEENIITLFYDEEDPKVIVGYMNNRTTQCYELTSYLDYTNYSTGINALAKATGGKKT